MTAVVRAPGNRSSTAGPLRLVSAYSSSRAKQLYATELPRPVDLYESGNTVYALAQEFSIKPPDGVRTPEGGRRPVPPQLAQPGRSWVDIRAIETTCATADGRCLASAYLFAPLRST